MAALHAHQALLTRLNLSETVRPEATHMPDPPSPSSKSMSSTNKKQPDKETTINPDCRSSSATSFHRRCAPSDACLPSPARDHHPLQHV